MEPISFLVMLAVFPIAIIPLVASSDRDDAPPVDEQDNRDYDREEGGRQRRTGRRPPSPASRPIPRTPPATNAAAVMSSGFANLSIPMVERPEISTYMPSFQMFCYVISEMDHLMSVTKLWNSYATVWTPFHSQLYWCTAAMIHILRCQKSVGALRADSTRLLRRIEDSLEIEDIPIPGPLVIFFTALSSAKVPLSNYGFVTPSLSSAFPTAANRHGVFADEFMCLLPALPAIRRAIYWLKHILRTNDQTEHEHIMDHFNDDSLNPVPPGYGDDSRASYWSRITPGTMFTPAITQATCRAVRSSPDRFRIPTTVANCDTLDLTEYLGFAEVAWFERMTTHAKKFCRHWEGSTTLASIAPRNGEVALFWLNYADPIDNQTHTPPHDRPDRYYVDPAAPPNNVVMSGSIPMSSSLILRDLLTTQINVVISNGFAPTNNVGHVGVTRFGPFWDRMPDEYSAVEVETAATIATKVVDLHIDKPNPSS